MRMIDLTTPPLLIIGNGFDLNLGLKTSYTDFINSNEFADGLVDNKLCKYLKEIHDLQHWVDIERELKYYPNQAKVSINDVAIEFEQLCTSLKKYLCEIDKSDININSDAYRIYQSLVQKYQGRFNVIDFNYTSTINKLNTIYFPQYVSGNSHIKIHGSIKNNNIIFGVEDSANISQSYIFLKKSFASNFGEFSVGTELRKSPEIIFFGISLGESDHSHFNTFFMECSDDEKIKKNITFYFYGKDSYKNLMIQLDKMTANRLGNLKSLNNIKFIDLKTI